MSKTTDRNYFGWRHAGVVAMLGCLLACGQTTTSQAKRTKTDDTNKKRSTQTQEGSSSNDTEFTATDTDTGTDSGSGSPPPSNGAIPSHLQIRTHVVNIVSKEASEDVSRYLSLSAPVCPTSAPSCRSGQIATTTFYKDFLDEYDFIYLFTDKPSDTDKVSGISTRVFFKATASIGVPVDIAQTGYGSAGRLKSVVALSLRSSNGPTLHETLHHWGVDLDKKFGIGNHWGMTSIPGQLGGFDPDSVKCDVPAGGKMPCQADSSGKVRFQVNRFGTFANYGDSRPYAPMELYLMGLVPASELPSKIYTLQNGSIVEASGSTYRVEADAVRTVSMADIIATQGERQPVPESERHFKAAFVIFSESKVSEETLNRVERWAAIFGGDTTSSLYSFERATRGLAKMDAKIGQRK